MYKNVIGIMIRNLIYRTVKHFSDKRVRRNCVFETLGKRLWQIQGLPVFLVYDSIGLHNLNYEILCMLHRLQVLKITQC